MDTEYLKKFDLKFPGIWIEGKDRDWASAVQLVLSLAEDLYIEAAASYGLFRPITYESTKEAFESRESRYLRCLNGIYAKTIVFSLHGIERLLNHLSDATLHPPPEVPKLCADYQNLFGHLKHIRDSAIHLEDRGRGVTRSQKPVPTNILVIGGFIENHFTFSGEDGNLYEIEISERTLEGARNIIQGVINSYPWTGPGVQGTQKRPTRTASNNPLKPIADEAALADARVITFPR